MLNFINKYLSFFYFWCNSISRLEVWELVWIRLYLHSRCQVEFWTSITLLLGTLFWIFAFYIKAFPIHKTLWVDFGKFAPEHSTLMNIILSLMGKNICTVDVCMGGNQFWKNVILWHSLIYSYCTIYIMFQFSFLRFKRRASITSPLGKLRHYVSYVDILR